MYYYIFNTVITTDNNVDYADKVHIIAPINQSHENQTYSLFPSIEKKYTKNWLLAFGKIKSFRKN